MIDYAEKHRRETAEEVSWQDRLSDISPRIAEGLGDGWAVVPQAEKPYHPTCDLSGPDGLLLDLRVQTFGAHARGRLEITGSSNGLYESMEWKDREVKRTITVDFFKSVPQIVQAIMSRLMPVYVPIMERARANRKAHDATATRVAVAARQIATTFAAQGGRIADNTRYHFPGDTVYFQSLPTVHLDSDLDVYFESGLEVGMEKAIRILKILAE